MDVDIPLLHLKNQTEVLIPLLTPINSDAFLCEPCCCWKLVPFLCLRQGQISIEQIPEFQLQTLSSSYHNSQQAHRAEAGDTDTSWYRVSLGKDSPAIAWETLLWGIPNTAHWVLLCCMGHLETWSCFEVSEDSAFFSWVRGCFLMVSLASHCFPAKAGVWL